MAQRTGALVFDERTDRYDIRFDLNTYYGGLHCGECFDVFVRGKWKPRVLLIGLIFVTAISPQAPPLFPLYPLGMRFPSRLRGVLSG